MDCATESDIGTGAEMLATSVCTAGRGRFSPSRFLFFWQGDYWRLFRGRRLFDRSRRFLTWWHRGSAPVGLRLFLFRRGDLRWHFFRSRQRVLRHRCSVLRRHCCQSLRCCFRLFLFRLLGLNHLAGLKLIRKIRRSRLLSSTQVRTGEANTSAHNEENPSARTHRRNLPPRREKVKLTAVCTSLRVDKKNALG